MDNYQQISSNYRSLKCFYANVRSIRKKGKFDELLCVIRSFTNILDIVVLTETWLKSENDARLYHIPNYTHYYDYRTDRRGGGVSVYVHNDIKHSLKEKHYIAGNNYLWLHIDKLSIDIGVVYKPERDKLKEFLATYEQQLERTKRAIVLGDFNVDLLSQESSTMKYRTMLEESGFKIINKINEQHCTRETATTKTLIDHICTNLHEDNFHLAVIESSMSDHKQLYLELKRRIPTQKQKIQYKAICYDKLYECIQKNPIEINNQNYNNLEKYIKLNIENCTINKTKILNLPKDDWINKEIIIKINERNVLWQKIKREPTNIKLRQEFIKARNYVTTTIAKTKTKYYTKGFQDCLNKPKKMWSLINSLARNKHKTSSIPSKLKTNSGTITALKDICNCFNDYFSSIGATLANNIPPKFHNNTVNTLPPCNSNQKGFSEFTPCTTDELSKIISKLDSNSSSGIDNISTKTIKCIQNLITREMTDSINECLQNGTFPETLKVAKVTPIYKSSTKSDPGNYRPISVLPVISKIFEKIIYKRLIDYLNSINFLSHRQYGFRSKHNTLAATIDLVTKIKNNIDKKNIVLGIYIDLKKAFDTVSHSILLQKLENIGITGTALKMFKSYLSNRHQIVQIENCESEPRSITYGVPQGSILGPLLFLTYINSIDQIGLKGHLTLYADDTCLFYFGHQIDDLITEAQNDLNRLYSWYNYNLLTINASKTCYTVFSAKNKKIPNHADITINNEKIHQKNEERYLGLILDHGLSWNAHTEHVRLKLTCLTGALRNIASCLPRQIRYNVYNSLVKPHLDYLIEIWGTAAPSNLKDLQISQNKLIKVLFSYHYLTPTKQLYKDTKIMNIKQSYIYNTCILIKKIINKEINTEINFRKNFEITKRRLRNANDLYPQAPRTNFGKHNIMHEGAKLYNSLPPMIKQTKSTTTFKILLKKFVSDNYS